MESPGSVSNILQGSSRDWSLVQYHVLNQNSNNHSPQTKSHTSLFLQMKLCWNLLIYSNGCGSSVLLGQSRRATTRPIWTTEPDILLPCPLSRKRSVCPILWSSITRDTVHTITCSHSHTHSWSLNESPRSFHFLNTSDSHGLPDKILPASLLHQLCS